MDSTTLLACNKRFIVSAVGDRISTRRTNEALTLLKPDFLGHKGEVTHVTIHQPDHLYGTQDDWGRVVASSDVTNRVKVWLCDGEEEELMFARNMAEYVGYEKVTALGWTADSKVAIGDVSGNFIVFNARYATSRYNRTLAKPITAIAPSHNDPHIHAVGYEDGAILLIRTNPTFQILFTNSKAHSAPIVSLAWRPEFSAARTYTEKDGKVHKSSAEDMALLASCPLIKGEFRIWAWSAKTEKLTGFRDGKDASEEAGVSNSTGALYWSRNGKVVQFIEGEVRIWDVKKLQIQSEPFLSASEDMRGIAVDGHRGIIYTLNSSGVVEKHSIPTKPSNPALPTPLPPLPPAPAPVESPSSAEPERAPSPLRVTEPERAPTPQLRVPTPPRASTPEPPKSLRIPESVTEPKRPISPSPVDRSSSEMSIDSLSKVKQMARQFDEDGLSKKKNNFIANAKAMYQPDRRKRTFSNESDLISNLSRTASPDPDRILESRIRSPSSSPSVSRQPSLFDIATSRVGSSEDVRRHENPSETKVGGNSQIRKDERPPTKIPVPVDPKRSRPPEPPVEKPTYQVVPPAELSPSFKPFEHITRQPSPVPLAVTIPNDPVPSSSTGSATITPNPAAVSPSIDRLHGQTDFLESPILGESMYRANVPVVEPASHPEPVTESQQSYSPIFDSPVLPVSTPLQTIPEETPALKIIKEESIPGLSIVKTESFEGGEHVKMTFDLPPSAAIRFSDELNEQVLPTNKNEPPPATPWMSSPPSSSASSKLAEPTSSYEDLGGISMDDQDHTISDARSDTSVEPMDDDIKPASSKVITPRPTITIPDTPPTSTPATNTRSATPETSPVAMKSSPSSRASRIWAEKNGTQIHTQIVEYMSDGEEETPSPYHSAMAEQSPPAPIKGSSSSEGTPIDHMGSPTPYKHSLKDYDLFRGLTRKLACKNKDHLDAVIATKLTQQNICKMVFGYDNVRELIQEELDFTRKLNIGLSELALKLWLGEDIDDEALLKAILFGKNNGLSDALILSIAPLAGVEVWESLMLWCTEVPSAARVDISQTDIFKGNLLVRTHLYAGFLCYTGSWRDAMGVYRKAKMYREAILMALMTLLLEERESERLVNTLKDLFRNWGDQVASQNGDGLLVSMCFAASMVTYEPTVKPRKQSRTDGSRSPVIPVIRTQKPSPTDSTPKSKSSKSGSALDSPQGRNWAELATFMRTQREKGFAEIRVPTKTVHFKPDSPKSGSSSPSLSIPSRPRNGSRPNSPAGRSMPVRRYAEDEDWSSGTLRRRPSPRVYMDERAASPAPRRPSLPHQSPRSGSPAVDSSTSRRRVHDTPSPLTFGARGTGVKPYALPAAGDAPAIPHKDEKRDRSRGDDREMRRGRDDERKDSIRGNGIGLGIQGHGTRDRVVGRI